MDKIKEYRKEKNPFRLFGYHLAAISEGAKHLVRPKRITLMYPEEVQELPTGYRGFIRFYKDLCTGCTMCAVICPADAMKMVTQEGKKFPRINYGRCIFCSFCVDICPVDALKETPIHDVAFTSREQFRYSPDEFNKEFQEEPPLLNKPVKRVKPVIDEDRGVVYVPDEQ